MDIIESLRRQIEQAESEGDTDKAKRLRARLADLQADDENKPKNKGNDENPEDAPAQKEDKEDEEEEKKEEEEKEDEEREDKEEDKKEKDKEKDEEGEHKKEPDGQEEGQQKPDANQDVPDQSSSPVDKKGKEVPSGGEVGNEPGGSGGTTGAPGTSSAPSTQAGSTGGAEAATTGGAEAAATGGAEVAATGGAEAAAVGGTEMVAVGGAEVAAAGGAGGAAGGAAVAATPVGWVILAIIVIIIIIMLLMGIISFFTTIPELIKGKILEFLDGIWTTVSSWFIGENAKISEEDIGGVGQYLESMGYDLEGLGFVENSEDITRNEEGHITSMKSKYIQTYLANDLKAYLIRGDNFSFGDMFEHFFDGPRSWGFGLIELESSFWDWLELIPGPGTIIRTSRDLLDEHVYISREANAMIIDRINIGWDFWNATRDYYVYSLVGWTGKYAKPLPFLLTLHLSTLAPEFAFSVGANDEFDTSVVIALYDIEPKVNIVVPRLRENSGGELVITNGWKNVIEDTFSAEELREYGISDIDEVRRQARKFNSIKTAIPYITKVENHWYRDLDFSNAYNKIEYPDPGKVEEPYRYRGEVAELQRTLCTRN